MAAGRARVIAIDGPAASGKSTLARRLAETLGYLYFDTGLMYRAVTRAALDQGIPPEDETAVGRLAEEMEIDVVAAPADDPPYRVLVGGQDVTRSLRARQVDANVSQVSAYQQVRQAMTARQREIGQRRQVVMVGRDIGTVVLPDADLKIYLEASAEARARRRFLEVQAKGESTDYEAILRSMRARDAYDSTRSIAPLKPADDAVVLDTTDLSIDETYERTLALVRAAAQT